MESLVNYSSEEEQEDSYYKSMAERGNPVILNRTSGGGTRGDNSRNKNNSSSLEQESNKYKSNSSSGNNSNSRSSTSSSSNRRDRDDSNKDARDDQRSYGNGHKYDYKMNERNRSREYRSDYRDNGRRSQRDSERGGSKHTSSWQRDRYSGGSSSHQHRRYRSPDRSRDRRSDNYRTDYHRRSPSPHHYKKSSRYDQPRRGARSSRSPRSASRSRSRSRSRSQSRERAATATKPLEQARLSALEMERKLNATLDRSDNETASKSIRARNEALLSLPLSDNAPKQANVIAVAPSPLVTSSANTIAAEPAVIQLPSYYNPNIINPNKYAEQVQKRKLLWGAKKADDNASKWGSAQFSQDSDGKVASKFMRLMGIKSGQPTNSSTVNSAQTDASNTEATSATSPDIKSREAMFSNMEQQYEVARQATHTMRGVGLGFSSQARPF